MPESQSQHRFLTILCFGLVYVLWGSTYLAIDIAVEKIPPALMCGVRFLIAGILMLAYCHFAGQSITYTSRQLVQLAVVGILLLMGGNLTLSYAEQYVPTGLAALLIAITPLWLLVLDNLLLGEHRISGRGLVGLGLGVIGTVVLLWPELTATGNLSRKELWFSIALLGGSFSWALGSVLSKRWGEGASLSATGWQMTFAGAANLLLAIVRQDAAHALWTVRGVSAVVYLVIFGSLIGYTSYIWLLGHVPTSKVSTYAYVNPVVALFLGWLVLHERVDRYMLAGSVIVIASVALVTAAKVHSRTAGLELPAVETAGD
jgi:drug/metabolite transporter (DMT)-like permease